MVEDMNLSVVFNEMQMVQHVFGRPTTKPKAHENLSPKGSARNIIIVSTTHNPRGRKSLVLANTRGPFAAQVVDVVIAVPTSVLR